MAGRAVGTVDDDTVLHISNTIHDGIVPDVNNLVNIEILKNSDDTSVAVIHISEGDAKPYCVAQKGYTPQGVFMRSGSVCEPISMESIRRMIRDFDGPSFEHRRSSDQGLTFDSAARVFEGAQIELSQPQMQTLGVLTGDNAFTNLGLLLSDQNPYEVRCAVFSNERGLDFQSRKEFSGSVLLQAEQVLDYLDVANKLRSTFVERHRLGARDYPPRAIREAILNAIVHRDYELAGPVIVNVYPDRLEVISLGGLPAGITLEDAELGVSVPRNPGLAAVFYRLGLAEGYGTGIKAMRESYRESDLEPFLKPGHGSFVVALPNANYALPQTDRPAVGAACVENPPQVLDTYIATNAASREEALLELAREKDGFSRGEAQICLLAGRDATLAVINRLLDDGRLVKVGNTRSTRYCLPDMVEAVRSAGTAATVPQDAGEQDPRVGRIGTLFTERARVEFNRQREASQVKRRGQ